MALTFIPALLLRRRSEFPHAVVPNAAFGLAQARKLPICHTRANAHRRQFASTESQGSVEATRVLAWSQSQQRGVTCD